MFKVQKKTLANGLRVLLVPMENSQSINISVLVGVGSKNETKEISGISHFLEHLFFKGTTNRPDAMDIMKDLDRIGSEHNAFTSREVTGYWVKCASKDADVALDVVSDMFLNSLFKAEEIEKERGVVLQEINMFEDDPHRKATVTMFDLMFGDQPAGWSVLGSEKSVKEITRDDIVKYRDKKYTPQNTVVIVSGKMDKAKMFKEINKRFSVIKKTKKIERKKTDNKQNAVRLKFVEKSLDQSNFRIGIRGYDMFNKNRYAFMLLSKILGENSSSRLWTEIREKLGLAYIIFSGTFLQTDTGILIIGGGVDHDKLKRTIEETINVISRIKKEGVTEEELADAKSHARGQVALGFETSDQVADFYGERELFYGKIEQPKEILKEIEKVTQDDILKVAKEIFKPKNFSMAVIGKNKNSLENQEMFKKIFNKI